MQTVVVAIVIILAVSYASWLFYDAIRDGGDPCKGCELKKNCQKFCQNKKK